MDHQNPRETAETHLEVRQLGDHPLQKPGPIAGSIAGWLIIMSEWHHK